MNKCFKSFASRRESDSFVADGRVSINGTAASPGARVHPGDIVELDGEAIDWERLNVDIQTSSFTYLKMWKDIDVICTTDPTIPGNIISIVKGLPGAGDDRIFPVGRLDEMSSGVILLTSDGRLPEAVLGASNDCAKEYIVTPDLHVTDEDMEELRRGVVITTVAQRDRGVRKSLTAQTLPCGCERQGDRDLYISLREGRNRQIRKMLGALGYTARAIHRVGFMGITLDGLERPGDFAPLNDKEMAIIEARLRAPRAGKSVETPEQSVGVMADTGIAVESE